MQIANLPRNWSVDAYRTATGEPLAFLHADVEWSELAMRNLVTVGGADERAPHPFRHHLQADSPAAHVPDNASRWIVEVQLGIDEEKRLSWPDTQHGFVIGQVNDQVGVSRRRLDIRQIGRRDPGLCVRRQRYVQHVTQKTHGQVRAVLEQLNKSIVYQGGHNIDPR